MLFKLRNLPPLNDLIDIKNSFVVPFLYYGRTAWVPAFASYNDCISKIQKSTIDTIPHLSYLSHSLPSFIELKLLCVSEKFHLKLYIYI